MEAGLISGSFLANRPVAGDSFPKRPQAPPGLRAAAELGQRLLFATAKRPQTVLAESPRKPGCAKSGGLMVSESCPRQRASFLSK